MPYIINPTFKTLDGGQGFIEQSHDLQKKHKTRVLVASLNPGIFFCLRFLNPGSSGLTPFSFGLLDWFEKCIT